MNDDMIATCSGVSKRYASASATVDALNDIDASFARGTVTAVVGPSGSGKSSLLRIIAACDRPSAGSVEVGGIHIEDATRSELRKLRRRIGFIYQRPSDNTISYLAVGDHLGAVARLRGAPRDVVAEAAELVGLQSRMAHLPHQLSGGEQQRLAFAQALVGHPPLIVADEPTAQLDRDNAAIIIELVTGITRGESSVVVATHDPDLAGAADAVIPLRHGRHQGWKEGT